jgi:hypothetical protein
MAEQLIVPRSEDLISVGSRISWGAILAGAVLAFGLYSLLTILGGAVGISISERMNPTTLHWTAVAWALVTMVASIFVGGVVTSQFTVGENKTEAMLYGVIMWALLFGILAALSAAGVRSGFHALAGMANHAEAATTPSWDKLARVAGVPADQIDTWRRNLGVPPDRPEASAQEVSRETVTRLAWYAFMGTWVSMIAAALGAVVGAGPTFKVVAVRPTSGMAR